MRFALRPSHDCQRMCERMRCMRCIARRCMHACMHTCTVEYPVSALLPGPVTVARLDLDGHRRFARPGPSADSPSEYLEYPRRVRLPSADSPCLSSIGPSANANATARRPFARRATRGPLLSFAVGCCASPAAPNDCDYALPPYFLGACCIPPVLLPTGRCALRS